MGWFSKSTKEDKTDATGIVWKTLSSEAELDAVIARSHEIPVVLFKHSTRCSISTMAKSRFERSWDIDATAMEPYYLDLIAFRSVSNKISADLGVVHQSPQVILIKDGQAVYDTSHNDINVADLKEHLNDE